MKVNLIHFSKEFTYRLKEDDISAWASQLTFYILLSIFPFLIFIIEILNHITFDNSEGVYELTQFFPPEIISFFKLIIKDISQVETSRSVLSIAIIGTIWASSRGILAIIRGLNMAYKEKETRSYFYLRALSLLYTVAFAFIILITLGFIVFGNKIIKLVIANFSFLTNFDSLFDLLRYVFSVILLFLFFTLLYNITPNRKITFKAVIPGSVFATISWISVSYFFSIYVNLSKNLSYMYGSLTSIIILLLWLYISSMIIMIGGELNAVISEKVGLKP